MSYDRSHENRLVCRALQRALGCYRSLGGSGLGKDVGRNKIGIDEEQIEHGFSSKLKRLSPVLRVFTDVYVSP